MHNAGIDRLRRQGGYFRTVPEASVPALPLRRGLMERCGSALDWAFGFAALIAALAIPPRLGLLTIGSRLPVNYDCSNRDEFLPIRSGRLRIAIRHDLTLLRLSFLAGEKKFPPPSRSTTSFHSSALR